MKFINVTPHPVNVYNELDCNFDPKTRCYSLKNPEVITAIATFDPSGIIARCSMVENEIAPVDGFKVFATSFGEVLDLPDPVPGTYYIVSAIVLNALPDRKDLLVPSRTVRDETGKVIGCCAFSGRE